MTQPAARRVGYDPEVVISRAYGRIGELLMQVDQLTVVCEAQQAELDQLRQTTTAALADQT